ncbi:DUF488 domain-containing protein [Flavitalea flava]
MIPVIKIKRAYEKPEDSDGFRVLVDRLWPRGVEKATADFQEWVKDLAPTTELRKWFGHDPEKWSAFQHKYKTELEKNGEAINGFLENHEDKRIITLVYGAKDEQHTHALVLKDFLDKRFHKK